MAHASHASRIVALFAMCALASGSAPLGGAAPVDSFPMPAFEMPLLEGETVTDGDFDGKVLVVDFWAI
jgi:hypothetical protein